MIHPKPEPPAEAIRQLGDGTAFEFGLVDYAGEGAARAEARLRLDMAKRECDCLYLAHCRIDGLWDAVYAIGTPRKGES